MKKLTLVGFLLVVALIPWVMLASAQEDEFPSVEETIFELRTPEKYDPNTYFKCESVAGHIKARDLLVNFTAYKFVMPFTGLNYDQRCLVMGDTGDLPVEEYRGKKYLDASVIRGVTDYRQMPGLFRLENYKLEVAFQVVEGEYDLQYSDLKKVDHVKVEGVIKHSTFTWVQFGQGFDESTWKMILVFEDEKGGNLALLPNGALVKLVIECGSGVVGSYFQGELYCEGTPGYQFFNKSANQRYEGIYR